MEELLRPYSTVQMIRTVRHDVEFAGVQMKQGDLVVCASQIGNREPDEFSNPDHVDLSRNANRHMAFAYGVHRCLGSHLARRERWLRWRNGWPAYGRSGSRREPPPSATADSYSGSSRCI